MIKTKKNNKINILKRKKKQTIKKINKYKRGYKYSKIQKGGSSIEPVVNEEKNEAQVEADKNGFHYIDIKNDGWCFYRALILGNNYNDLLKTPKEYNEFVGKKKIEEAFKEAMKSRETDLKPITVNLAKEFSDWLKTIKNLNFKSTDGTDINLNKNLELILLSDNESLKLKPETSVKLNEDALKTIAEYADYTIKEQTSKITDPANGFNDPGPLLWPLPTISGYPASQILQSNLIIYKKGLTKPQTIKYQEYPNNIYLYNFNGNHFDLLIPKRPIIGLGYDGVLTLSVGPLLNSKDSRQKISGDVPNHEFIDHIENYKTKTSKFENVFIITKSSVEYGSLNGKIIQLIDEEAKKYIKVAENSTKIEALKTNKISHFFDDSNSNIFDVIKAKDDKKLPDLKKLYKVFPETFNDLFDKTSIKGTLNPIMVEVSNQNQIKVLTYNIQYDLKGKPDINIKNVGNLLDKYMETDKVDFMCLQEFSYVDDINKDSMKLTPYTEGKKFEKNMIPEFEADGKIKRVSGKINYTENQYKEYNSKETVNQIQSNHPFKRLKDKTGTNTFSDVNLNKYKYVYNFQPQEHQFTFYDSDKYEIAKLKTDNTELIIKGSTSVSARPFTLIVFKNKTTGRHLVLINVHLPHKKSKKNDDIMNNEYINYRIIQGILNYNKNDKSESEIVAEIKEYLIASRIIVAGDFNRNIDSNTKQTEKGSLKFDNVSIIKDYNIDNSSYGLKLFGNSKESFYNENGLLEYNKPIIMYNIPLVDETFKNSTCNTKGHIDNVLDSFGLQCNYEYGDNVKPASDHIPVLVTLYDAIPIYREYFNEILDINMFNMDFLLNDIVPTQIIQPPPNPPPATPAAPIVTRKPVNYCY